VRKVHGQGEYNGEYGMGGGKEACEAIRVRKRARIDYYHRPEEERISQILPILCSPRHKGSIFSSPFI